MAKRDPRNPLMTAANREFGPLSDNVLQSKYASEAGMPPVSDDPYDDPASQQRIQEAMQLASKNKLQAMNGAIPMSPQSWLQQAWTNLNKGYNRHLERHANFIKNDSDVKNLQEYWNVGNAIQQQDARMSRDVTANDVGNPARGVPARQPQSPGRGKAV